MYKRKSNNSREFNTCVTVTAAECGGNAEKMVRKFSKKVKKEGIVEEYRERSHFIKPTFIRAEKKRAKKRLINKVNKRREELFNFNGPIKRRR